jgi:uncharacterized membrane protein YbaN (DUF454 family)
VKIDVPAVSKNVHDWNGKYLSHDAYNNKIIICLTRCLLLVSEISYNVANLLLRDVVLCGIMFHCVYHCYLIISAYSFEGILVFSLLVICTCAYMRRVPRLKQWFLSEKKGFLGMFYKGN